MSGVIKSAVGQLGGLAKHVATQAVRAPFEILKDATGVKSQDKSSGDQLDQLETNTGGNSQQQGQSGQRSDYSGFKSAEDYMKYVQLSGKKDEIEMNMLRKRLHAEYGLTVDTEAGMQKARIERQKTEEERAKVEEREEEQEKVILEEKSKENIQVSAVKAGSSAETKIGKKIAG